MTSERTTDTITLYRKLCEELQMIAEDVAVYEALYGPAEEAIAEFIQAVRIVFSSGSTIGATEEEFSEAMQRSACAAGSALVSVVLQKGSAEIVQATEGLLYGDSVALLRLGYRKARAEVFRSIGRSMNEYTGGVLHSVLPEAGATAKTATSDMATGRGSTEG